MIKVLIVEDDINLASIIERVLIENDMDTDVCHDGLQVMELLDHTHYDVILLDLMLPGKDGISICKEIRQEGYNISIIMLTAKGEIADRVAGLEAGADDYIPKPFSPKELVARIQAVNRRFDKNSVNEIMRFGDLEYRPNSGDIACKNESITLSEKENLLMLEFMQNPGIIKSKSDLLEAVWDNDDDININNVEAYISFLRKKMSFVGTSVQIKTLRKLGYRLELP